MANGNGTDKVVSILNRMQSFFQLEKNFGTDVRRAELDAKFRDGLAQGNTLSDPEFIARTISPEISELAMANGVSEPVQSLVHDFLYDLKKKDWEGWRTEDRNVLIVGFSYPPSATDSVPMDRGVYVDNNDDVHRVRPIIDTDREEVVIEKKRERNWPLAAALGALLLIVGVLLLSEWQRNRTGSGLFAWLTARPIAANVEGSVPTAKDVNLAVEASETSVREEIGDLRLDVGVELGKLSNQIDTVRQGLDSVKGDLESLKKQPKPAPATATTKTIVVVKKPARRRNTPPCGRDQIEVTALYLRPPTVECRKIRSR